MDQIIKQMWHRSISQKIAFFSCFISGYLVHLFAYTNIIPNSDGVGRVFDAQQMTISGRWFLHAVSSFYSFTQMPVVIAFLSVLFLSISAMLVVDILSIKGNFISAVIGIFMVSFFSVGYANLYLFTASSYAFAILLSVFSVFCITKGGKSVIFGSIALALSMGIYQAYAALAIALSLLYLMRMMWQSQYSVKKIIWNVLMTLSYLIAAVVLYYIILTVFLKVKQLEPLDYLGIRDVLVDGYPFSLLGQRIKMAYLDVAKFFFIPYRRAQGVVDWMAVGHWILLVVSLPFVWNVLSSMRKKFSDSYGIRLIGLFVAILLFPLAVGFPMVMSPYSYPTPLMTYSYVAIYWAFLIFIDAHVLRGPKWYKNMIQWLVLASFILLFGWHATMNNLLYTASAQAHRSTLSYATRLVSAIEYNEGDFMDRPLIIIGGFPNKRYFESIESYRVVDHYSVPKGSVVPRNKHIYYYLNDWLNIPVVEPEEQLFINISESSIFKAMPVYPEKGSIAEIDGCVVVKISQSYQPKEAFEIEYERRK